MATVRLQLKLDYERQLLRSPELLAAMHKAADHVAREARLAAPRRDSLPAGRERHYGDMIDGQAWIGPTGVVGTVNARHYTSVIIEFGSVNNPPYAPLRRGLDASAGRAL